MTDLLLIIVGAALVNNVVLTSFLGLCPFFGTSNRLEIAIGMSLATAFVLTLASLMSWIIHTGILEPFNLEYLRTLVFIAVIGATVQGAELFVRQTSPLLHQSMGLYLPLITTNCAVLGVALLNVNQQHGALESILFGLGSAVGFGAVLILFSSCRERIAAAPVPRAFRGTPIGLITAGLMALAFMGFKGFADL